MAETRTRSDLTSVNTVVSTVGSPDVITHTGTAGVQQRVTGTWDGSFKPGVFRACPVVMEKYTTTAEHASVSRPASSRNAAQTVRGEIANRFFTGFPTLRGLYQPYINAAAVKAKAKMGAVQMEMGVMFGESAKTLRMLVNPLKGLRNLLVNFLTNVKNVKKAKDISSVWLEYRYGLRPFMMDVEDTLNAVYAPWRRELNHRIERKMGKFVRPTEFTRTPLGWQLLTSSPCSIWGDWVTESSAEVTYYAHQYFTRIGTMNDRFGMDGANALSTLWELMPYSFVVDWFVDLGSWIKAVQPTLGLRKYPLVVSVKEKRLYTAYTVRFAWYDDSASKWIYDAYQGNVLAQSTYESLTRIVIEDLVVLPPLGGLLDWRRSLDAVALAYQTIPGTFRSPQRRGRYHAY